MSQIENTYCSDARSATILQWDHLRHSDYRDNETTIAEMKGSDVFIDGLRRCMNGMLETFETGSYWGNVTR